MIQILRAFIFILWSLLLAALCIVTLPIHLFVYVAYRQNTFSYMVEIFDLLTVFFFNDEK